MTEMLTTVIGLLVAIIGLVTLVIRGQAKAQRPNGGKSQYDLLIGIGARVGSFCNEGIEERKGLFLRLS